jgi:hypothetical protein
MVFPVSLRTNNKILVLPIHKIAEETQTDIVTPIDDGRLSRAL